MRSKIVESPAAAVADVADGASVVIGGFGVLHGWPSSVITALRDRAVRDLTLVCNTPGFGPLSPQILTEKHQVKKLVASFGGYPYRKTPMEEAIGRGEIEFELVPQGTLAERLRAGGAGLAGFFTPTGVGTDVERGKEVRDIDGRRYVFERALTADVAVVRAHAADPAGNLVFRGSSRNFHPIFATAGRTTIAEVDELVGLGDLDPERVVTPGIFVDRVVRATVRMTPDEVIDMVREIGRAAPDAGDLPGIPADLMAMRVAALFTRGSVVNLGIGLPTLCSNHTAERDVVLHAENGLINYGPFPAPGGEDIHLYNAGGQFVTALPGGAFTHTCDAFAMARGGRVDTIVLGGFQVAENGDLANWKAPHMSAGGIGGAMDLAAGRAEIIVLMYHASKDGQSKLLRRCSYPLTAIGCVSKVVTNLALIEVVPGQGFLLREIAPGIGVDDVTRATDAPLRVAHDVREMRFG